MQHAPCPFDHPLALVQLALERLEHERFTLRMPPAVVGPARAEVVNADAFGAAGLGAAQGLTTGVVYGVLALIGSLPGVLTLVRTSEQRQVRPERLDEGREHVPALVG